METSVNEREDYDALEVKVIRELKVVLQVMILIGTGSLKQRCPN